MGSEIPVQIKFRLTQRLGRWNCVGYADMKSISFMLTVVGHQKSINCFLRD
jgi:hypothetical protein